eukprot:scaffold56829_cov17-Tisochrysis_lutea.AAC.1
MHSTGVITSSPEADTIRRMHRIPALVAFGEQPHWFSAPLLTHALTAVWLSGHCGFADCRQGAAHQLLQGKQQGDLDGKLLVQHLSGGKE